MRMQRTLAVLYPDQCVSCGKLVEETHGLCGPCWAETPFLGGLCCDSCGVPLLGEAAGARPLCDECLATPRPWDRGAAVLAYRDNARQMVLSLKHGDRIDLARPAARWMAARGASLLVPGTCVVPVPLHWTRLVRRRFNQAALLAREVARLSATEAITDALVRVRRTKPQEKMTREERLANLEGAIRPHSVRSAKLQGRAVVLVDDVMTSGATLEEGARAVLSAGAEGVSALVLARVVKDA